MKKIFLHFQQTFTDSLRSLDPTTQFVSDQWERPLGGGGLTNALENGELIEKAGINFSHVFGNKLPPSACAHRPEYLNTNGDISWEAMGVSTIVHPKNPFVPTCHANIRIFTVKNQDGSSTWWTGGGFDLTPYYGFTQDCLTWHQEAKAACDPFGLELYPKFKNWADEYFYLKHRSEARGIGGIFFDDFKMKDLNTNLEFLTSVANHFQKAYITIFERRKNTLYDTNHRDWQLYRRGRYVEFNLVYDRGTLFGLQSSGRTESILISMPNLVQFKYDYKPKKGSLEEELLTGFLPPRDWTQVNVPSFGEGL